MNHPRVETLAFNLNMARASTGIPLVRLKEAVYHADDDERLPSFMIGKKIYIKKNDLDEWLSRMRQKYPTVP